MERLIRMRGGQILGALRPLALVPVLLLAVLAEAAHGLIGVMLGALAFVMPGVLTGAVLRASHAIENLLTLAVASVGIVLTLPIFAAIGIHALGLSIGTRSLAVSYALVSAALVVVLARIGRVPEVAPALAQPAENASGDPALRLDPAAARTTVRGLVGLGVGVLLSTGAFVLSAHSEATSREPFTETAFALSDGVPIAVVVANHDRVEHSYEVSVDQDGDSMTKTLTIPAGSTASVPLTPGEGADVRVVWPGGTLALRWSPGDS
jgi:hypothetical protein